MKITPTEEQTKILLKLSHSTKHSTGRIWEIYLAILEANFEEDILSAIDHLDEVEEEN